MLDPAFLLGDEAGARRAMARRAAGETYDAFLQGYRRLEACGAIDDACLLAEARAVTLDGLARGIAAGDELCNLLDAYLRLPNLLHPSVPDGGDGENDRIVREWWPEREWPASPCRYEEVAARLGIFREGASERVAAFGFPFLFGAGASLDRALQNYLLDSHRAGGYPELVAPTLVNERSMFTNGAFPLFAPKSFRVEGSHDGAVLYLNPTIEVQQTNLMRGCCLTAAELPVRYAGYSRSFRIEDSPMTAYTRLHEFGKVEIFAATCADAWEAEYERALGAVEAALQGLELPYRRVLLCAGSMGLGYHLANDFYLYAPGSDEWLEVASCVSNANFSSRRMNARYVDENGREALLHTLHVTAVALPRLLVAVLENYQTLKGAIELPRALRRYFDGETELGP